MLNVDVLAGRGRRGESDGESIAGVDHRSRAPAGSQIGPRGGRRAGRGVKDGRGEGRTGRRLCATPATCPHDMWARVRARK